MNALVRKEIRLLLPAWIVAMVVTVVPAWWSAVGLPDDMGYAVGGLALGSLILSLASYGQEFSVGTFPQSLAQPLPRMQLWRLKVGMLGVAMFSIFLAGLVKYVPLLIEAHYRHIPQIAFTLAMVMLINGSLVFAAFAGGLWTTLLFRQIAAAFWFTLLIPSAFFLFTWIVTQKMLQPPVESRIPEYCAFAILLLYSMAGFLWARRLFLRAQDTVWTGGTISLPTWVGSRSRPHAGAQIRGPFRALLSKEIQAHQVSLLLSAVLVAFHLVAIALRKAEFVQSSTEKTFSQVLSFWWSLWNTCSARCKKSNIRCRQ